MAKTCKWEKIDGFQLEKAFGADKADAYSKMVFLGSIVAAILDSLNGIDLSYEDQVFPQEVIDGTIKKTSELDDHYVSLREMLYLRRIIR